MAKVFPLGRYIPSDDDLQELIDEAPRCETLRDAVEVAIKTIHGLPDVVGGAGLQQIEVYWGRAGATPPLLRQRWAYRAEELDDAPSMIALVALRGSTARIRKQRWEDAGHRIIRALSNNGALCVANMNRGSGGPWPASRDCVLYLVVRKRRGPVGVGADKADVNAAIVELIHDDTLPDDAAREVRRVADPDDAVAHEIMDVEWEDDDEEDEEVDEALCRREGCTYRAKPGNYGFCGYHR